MNVWIKKNFSNIFIAVILIFMLATGRFNALFSKVKAYMGEDKGKTALNFNVENISDSSRIELEKLKGKVVLLNFWATWCPPCRYETPTMVSLYSKHQSKGFEIVGLSFDNGDKNTVLSYMKQEKINYPVGFASKEINDKYGDIASIPTAFLIDKNGKIQKKYVGVTMESTLDNDISSLLN